MDIVEQCKTLLYRNRVYNNGQQFTSPYKSNQKLGWESCFHAIILRHFDIKASQKEIISLLNSQKPDGRISTQNNLIHPPLIGYSVLKVFEKCNDFDFLEKIFPKLDRYYRWLSNVRDPYNESILSILNPIESGQEKSIIFRSINSEDILNKYLEDLNDYKFLNYFGFKDVLFNCVYLKGLRSMEEISKLAGRDHSYYRDKYRTSENSIKNLMFDKKKGLFFPVYNDQYKNLTVNIFLPLFSQILSNTQAKNLINSHLLNKEEFWLDYPIPTLSYSDSDFDSAYPWRGSISMQTNWFVFKGLLNYGFHTVAEDILEKSLELVKKGFWEFYNPLTGEGFGNSYFSSSALVLDMIK